MRYITVILFICWSLSGCRGNAGTEKVYFPLPEQQPAKSDIIDYFKLVTFDENSKENYNYINELLNEGLELDSVLNKNTDVVIRIISYQDFDTTEVFDMQMQQGTWTGFAYRLEYLTNKLLSKEEFVPLKGWNEFEKRIIRNDLLNTGIKKINLPPSCSFIHPRTYAFQIITSDSDIYLDYGAFFDYLHSCKIKEVEIDKMREIMTALFGEKNYSR
jgi:hypothetical protein